MYNFLNKLSLASLLVCVASFSSLSADCTHCAPFVSQKLADITLPYGDLYDDLTANSYIQTVTAQVLALEANPILANYNALLSTAYSIVNFAAGSAVLNPNALDTPIAAPVISPRIVITEADGTVIVDTGRWFLGVETPTPLYHRVSTLDNWLSGQIDENHNSRIAILDAQLYPCGVGLETKYSSTLSNQAGFGFPNEFPVNLDIEDFNINNYLNIIQDYVAVRLNAYNNSSDTNSYLRSAGTIRISVNTLNIN